MKDTLFIPKETLDIFKGIIENHPKVLIKKIYDVDDDINIACVDIEVKLEHIGSIFYLGYEFGMNIVTKRVLKNL